MLRFVASLLICLEACTMDRVPKPKLSPAQPLSAEGKSSKSTGTPGLDPKDRLEFLGLCESKSNEEITYTIQTIQEKIGLKDCESTYSYLSTTPTLSLRNGSMVDPEEESSASIPATRNIRDISVLKYARFLTELDLWFNSVSDLSPLQSLSYLKSINLSGNNVTNLAPLSSLPELEALVLSDNVNLASIDPLQTMTSLKMLRFSATKVESIGPLASLTALEDLDFSNTSVSDISPLSGLINLKILKLGLSLVPADGSSLGALSKMENLDVSGMSLPNASYLQTMSNLQTLSISLASTNDINLITKLPKLMKLTINSPSLPGVDLQKVQIDFGQLRTMQNLNVLSIRDSNLSNISFLLQMPNLTELTLKIPTIDPLALANLPNLKVFAAYSGAFPNFQFLPKFPNLEELYLQNGTMQGTNYLSSLTKLKKATFKAFSLIDLTLLAKLTNLEYLDLSSSIFSAPDLTPLASLFSLRILNLDNHQANLNLSGIATLNNLVSLSFSGSFDVTLTGIEKLSNLELLYANGSLKGSCEAFSSLTKLRFLGISSGSINDISCLRNLKNLKRLEAFGNPGLVSLAPLEFTPLLEKLMIMNTAVADISKLNRLKFLKHLDIYGTKISDLSPLGSMSRLKFVGTPDSKEYVFSNL